MFWNADALFKIFPNLLMSELQIDGPFQCTVGDMVYRIQKYGQITAECRNTSPARRDQLSENASGVLAN